MPVIMSSASALQWVEEVLHDLRLPMYCEIPHILHFLVSIGRKVGQDFLSPE